MRMEKPIAVTIATLFAFMLLSFPAFAGEATHFTFTKTGPLIMRPERMRPPGPFFTCLVDMRDVNTFPYDFALYFSTDHGRRVAIGSAGERSSGERKRTLELYEIFRADDGQALTRRARDLLGK